jgi:hypothetical protein
MSNANPSSNRNIALSSAAVLGSFGIITLLMHYLVDDSAVLVQFGVAGVAILLMAVTLGAPDVFRGNDMSKKDAVENMTMAILLSCTVLLAGIWFGAAGTGNSLTVTVNQFHERTPELIMWIVVVPLVSLGLQVWVSDDD